MSALRSIDYSNYRVLLRGLVSAHCSFALTDTSENVCFKDADFRIDVLGLARRQLERQQDNEGPMSAETIMLPGRTVLIVPVAIGPDVKGFLWLQTEATLDWPELLHSLEAIASCIVNELSLNADLDSMATELTERYEELNLVYHTQDEVNYFAEGQQALAQLVENCCEYLNVDMAALLMQDKGIAISHITDHSRIERSDSLLEKLHASIYSKVVEDRDAFVINDLASADAKAYWHGLPFKVLASPVLDSKGGASGILAIVNRNSKVNFANSHKNLLKVMARKAAKIVQVNYDQLTGLVNREGFEYFSEKRLQETRDQGSAHAVLHFNIDNLHIVNDTLHHDAGDAVLCAVAARLRSAVRDTDVSARLGGDEFGVLLKNCPIDRAERIADKLRESILEMLIPWNGRSLSTSVSVGVAPIDENTHIASTALTAAELACTAAKELGKNRVQRYEHGDTALARRHHEMEAVGRIQTALQEDGFELFGQIIAPLVDRNEGLHLEVLLRMRGDGEEILTPDKFLPAAERYNMMPDIDRHVVEKALAYLDERWAVLEPQLSMISLNLSGQTFGEPHFAEFLLAELRRIRVPAERICLEITETAAMNNLDEAQSFISRFKEQGCRFALDDFGAGLSSFGYLRTLAVDILKIDGSLVKEIVADEISMSMVTAIQHVATVMKLETVAEYVDSEAAKAKLREIGVSYAQGFGVSKPKPLSEHFVTELRSEVVAS